MGIRGLTTYIQNNADKYLNVYELHDCYIVVDGNNIASHLYNWVSKSNCAFGGDYDEYDKTVKDFFQLLRICGISPLVLLDGGYEPRKLTTAKSRLRSRIQIAKHVTPQSQTTQKIFPLMLKEVFKDTLRQMEVPFFQCDFEADEEIAALARNLKCPVLSYDSDFYIYDVAYIPFSTLCMEPVKCPNLENKFFIKCKMYSIENFLNSFGGLEKRMLPLLATILGNDYIKRSTFSNFLSQLKLPKSKTMSDTQKRIYGLLQWLRRETPETALKKVLGHLKKHNRERVALQIMRITSGYHPAEIHSALGLANIMTLSEETATVKEEILDEDVLPESNSLSSDIVLGQEKDIDKSDCTLTESETDDKVDSDSSCSETSKIVEKSSDTKSHEQNVVLGLPEWFKNSFRKGIFPTNFYDMLTQNIYFMPPQVEDYTLEFSHNISLPIIQTIHGLLKSGEPGILNCYTRDARGNLQKFSLNSVCSLPRTETFPSLADLPNLSLAELQNILLDTMGIDSESELTINTLPPEWKLYVIAIKYWFSHTIEPSLNSCHVHALVFSAVALNFISNNPKFHKSRKSLSCVLQKANPKCVVESLPTTSSCYSEWEKFLQISQSVQNESDALNTKQSISENDCRALASIIMPFQQISERMKANAHLFSITAVHAFAQFQSCLLHLRYLNALLGFPFPQTTLAKFYSGVLIHNLYTSFQKRSDVLVYISNLLQNELSIMFLYKLLIENIMNLLPAVPTLKRHRRKKKKKKAHTSTDDEDSSENQDIENEFVDMSNRFNILGTND